MIENGKLRFEDGDPIIVSDDVFRKIRQGREHTLPSKVPKKPWQK